MHLLFCIYVVSWVSGSSLQQWLCKETMDAVTTTPTMTLALVTKGGIKGFLNGSGDRKVSETFIVSVILCPSQITYQMHSAFYTEGLCSVRAFLPYKLYPKILMWLGIAGNKPHVSGAEGRGVSESRQKGEEEDLHRGPTGPSGLAWTRSWALGFICLLAHFCTSLSQLPAPQSWLIHGQNAVHEVAGDHPYSG